MRICTIYWIAFLEMQAYKIRALKIFPLPRHYYIQIHSWDFKFRYCRYVDFLSRAISIKFPFCQNTNFILLFYFLLCPYVGIVYIHNTLYVMYIQYIIVLISSVNRLLLDLNANKYLVIFLRFYKIKLINERLST